MEDCRIHKNMAILKLKGVDTVEDAVKYRNQVLYVDRDEILLEEGEYFVQDLIGLRVLDADSGKEYGKIVDGVKLAPTMSITLPLPMGVLNLSLRSRMLSFIPI